jgi:hypothetical protein
MDPSPKRITSSIKTKWVSCNCFTNFMPFKVLSSRVLRTNLLNHYAARRNKKGDKGKPFWISLDDLNNLDGDPFLNTRQLVEETLDMTQLVNSKLNPNYNKASLRKVQFTLSYTFSKSNFITRDETFFNLIV